MKKMILSALFGLLSVPAFASLSIDCGGTVDQDGNRDKPLLSVASEDGKFTGTPSDQTWYLKYNGTDYNGHKNVTAKLQKLQNGHQGLVISITTGNSIGGRVGEDLVIDQPNSDSPKLTVHIVGGIAGGVTTKYDCTGTQD